ncbi:hypothetical protein L207DRAFT_346681 [Hyaloscypha variabilis F]|uniref:DUF6590 domain-containing protein n=1 Tax=Hyaloscypha variabilis (strain UAMH 11265 / GT02V1 / F) TaxID=1149755 RepID=A0A2J6RQS2_HYAVF|nr:hypothetical protein L207DRAFT_346681 [Hyaloscypha variabilis F]
MLVPLTANFFKIFKILWAEPKGAEGGGSSRHSGTESDSITTRKVPGGKETFAKVRRFVIIKAMEGHCICLPILTYSGQGLNKKGVHADYHAIIYSGKKPIAFRGEKEKGLRMRSIKATPDSSRHKLDDASRLNYAKQYTVEYNVKVWFIGRISSDSEWQLRTDYNRIHPPLEVKGCSPATLDDVDLLNPPLGYPGAYFSSPNLVSTYPSTHALDNNVSTSSADYNVDRSTEYSSTGEHAEPSFPARSPDAGYGTSSYPGYPSGGATYNSAVYGPGGHYGSNSTGYRSSYLLQDLHPVVEHEDEIYPEEIPRHREQIRRTNMYSEPGLEIHDEEQDTQESTAIFSTLSKASPDRTLDGTSPAPLNQIHHASSKAIASPAQPTDHDEQKSESSSSTESGSFKPSRASSATSWSAGDETVLIHQYLVNIVSQDADLQALCDQAVHKPTWDCFEKNLRQCLVNLSRDVLAEVQSRQGIQAAKAIQNFAKSAARSIKDSLELQQEELNQQREALHHLATGGDPDLRTPFEVQEWTNEASQLTEDLYRLAAREDPHSLEMLEPQEWTEETKQRAEMYCLPAETDAYYDGSDEDEMEPIDFEQMAEFKSFKDLVVSSMSFGRFKESFDLCMNPDPARSAVLQQWPKPSSKTSLQLLSYDVEWDLEHFVETHVKDPTRIGDLITLTGESVDAEAISTREYLMWAWPIIGNLLLEGIELLLLHKSKALPQSADTKFGAFCIDNKAAKLEFILGEDPPGVKSSVLLKATAAYTTHAQIASALSWICASFRCSSNDEVMMSSTIFDMPKPSAANDTTISIRLDRLHNPSTISCWHALFPNRVVSRGFRIHERKEGVGLEIAFEDMIAASRCLSLLEYDDGLIAHGLTNILIPTADLKNDDAIQWHLENKMKQKLFKLARISQVLSTLPDLHNRLKGLQPENLTQRRCFLGLAEHSNVVIGTKDYQRTFVWSGSEKAPSEAYVKSHSLTVTSGFMGTFGGNGTYTRTAESLRSTIFSPQEKDIFDILESGKEHLGLLYDTAQNIGWYLPQISIALQMTHTIISMRGYRLYDENSNEFDFPETNSVSFANAGPDAALEASDAVKRSLRLKIRKFTSASSGPVDTDFTEMFTKVWHTPSNAETGLEVAESDFRKVKQTAPKFLHGIEFLDAANMETSIRIKVVEVDQPWVHLTSEQPLVMLSKSFQHPIVPDSSSLCTAWQCVPSNRGYLVSTGIVISSFLDRRNEGLAAGLDWSIGKELIESHKPAKKPVPVNHLQRLVLRKKLQSNIPIRELMEKCQNGCFVFGRDTTTYCRESIVASGNPLTAKSITTTSVVATTSTLPSSATQKKLVSPIKGKPQENNSALSCQNTATIRLKIDNCETESSLYVVNGSAPPTDLNSKLLPGNGSSLVKITPRFKGTFQKLFSSSQEKASSRKSLEQAGLKACGNGSAAPGELDDLYDA